ncbi:hypothetical protein PENANT_c035G06411, partial [Penicillium antarcticum]
DKSLKNELLQLGEAEQSLKNEILQLKKATKLQSHQNLLIRGAELDLWAGITDSDRTNRNLAVHGGNIELDVTVIRDQDMIDPAHAEIWKSFFHKHYNLEYLYSHEQLHDFVDVSPPILKIFNSRADISIPTREWRKVEVCDRHKLLEACDEFIEAFKQNPNTAAPIELLSLATSRGRPFQR